MPMREEQVNRHYGPTLLDEAEALSVAIIATVEGSLWTLCRSHRRRESGFLPAVNVRNYRLACQRPRLEHS